MKELINNNHLKMDTDKEFSTLRDHFAGLAMQGMLSNPKEYELEQLGEMAYYFADEMLKGRG